jgi:ABC-type nitrate/sulfonate/bicarbonate transport system substrate-binding protein
MQLSGGMQQRVALGRALLQNTDIIFFDEPFSALDIQTRSQMQELLLDLWHEEHKTIVFVTHDIDEAVYLSETIYVLGSHPARIEQRVDVDLARPRIADMRFTQEFTKIKKSIIYALRTATIQTKLQHSLQGGGHTLGLFVWSGNSPWYYAYEKGQIDDELSLVSIESNTNGLEKLLKGELSMLNVTLDFAVKAIEQNPSLEIVMPLNYSTGGDALVLGSHLNAVHQLSGKRIGIERHAVSHFFLMYLLDKHGIDPNTIQEINMLGGDIGAALIRGDIDAGVLWEPWLSQARDLSEGVIAESTEQLENQILHDVIIAPRTFIQDNQNLIQNMRESWDTAIDEIHSDQAIKTVSSLLGISHTDVRRSLEGITFVPHTSNLFVDAMKKIKEFYKK